MKKYIRTITFSVEISDSNSMILPEGHSLLHGYELPKEVTEYTVKELKLYDNQVVIVVITRIQ